MSDKGFFNIFEGKKVYSGTDSPVYEYYFKPIGNCGNYLVMIKRLLALLEPPQGWKPAVIILLGIFTGIVILTFHASEAHSYISDDPKTCINCHVMYPQYASWSKSSHHEAATCAQCHVPQDNFISKYYVKGTDGMRHAYVFTSRNEPQVIQIKQRGTNVVQENCIRCHLDLVDMISLVEVTGESHEEGDGSLCWDCHRTVPHGKVRSLSSAPWSLVPRLPSVMPAWLQDFIQKRGD